MNSSRTKDELRGDVECVAFTPRSFTPGDKATMVPLQILTLNLLPFKEMDGRLERGNRSGTGPEGGTMPDDYLQGSATRREGTLQDS
jgi:hypothetical protein